MSDSIQAVIWDLDGVIIDSAKEHRRAWDRLVQEEGLVFTDTHFWATLGKRNDTLIPLFWGPMPPERVRELADRKESYFHEFIRDTAIHAPGSIDLLTTLQDAGYPQALASSTPSENIELISEVLGLKRYLSSLVCGETVPHGKPAPDVFLKAAAELGIRPERCLVIEDAVVGVEAAHAAGMRCIAVAGERDLPGLRAAELMVKDLTEVTLGRIRQLASRSA